MPQKATRPGHGLILPAAPIYRASAVLYCGEASSFITCRRVVSLISGVLAVWLATATWAAPVSGQTQYQFVPGSRQAKAVTATQQQASPQGYIQRPASVGGMQLRSAPLVPAPTAYPSGGRYIQQQSASAAPQSSRQSTTQTTVQTQTQSRIPSQKDAARAGQKSYDFADSLSVDGVPRTYRVHIPPSYDRARAAPVVLAFHGVGMNSMAMLAMSGLNGLSDRKGFIVVYGDGVGNRWNDGTGGADDIGYVSEVLKKLATRANIDQRRIYACGISNGGYFTQRLACTMPDRIAAAAVVASTMMAGPQMAGGNRMPIVFFLGTEDPLLPWADGRTKGLGKLGESLGLSGLGSIDNPMARMGGLMSVPEMIGFWTNVNGCAGSPSVSQMPNQDPKDGTTVKKETYGSGDVVVYVIDGGGHTWPGMIEVSTMKDLCGVTSQDIDASELMWEFFQRHSR